MKKEGESSCINDICLRLRSLPSKLEYGISRNNERRKLFIDVQIFYLQLEALICCETSCTWNMIWSTPYTFCLNFMDTYVILPSTAAWSYILRATWSIAETIFDQLLQLKMNYQFSLRIKIKNDFWKRYITFWWSKIVCVLKRRNLLHHKFSGIFQRFVCTFWISKAFCGI